MLAYFADWELGIHPVSVGRAPWLPSPFMHAMHEVRSAQTAERNEAIRRANARAK